MAKKRKVSKKVSRKSVKVSKSSKAPLGIKIISVISFVVAFLTLIYAIALIVLRKAITELIPTSMLIPLIIALVIVAILHFFIGRGLLKLQKWSRIVVIILAILIIINSIMMIDKYQFVRGIVCLVIVLVIALYLIFNKNVRKAFA